jgi:hypothetical protein
LCDLENENSNKVYFYISEKIAELSKQNTGWKNYYRY